MTPSKPSLIRDKTLKALIQDKLRAFSVQTAPRLQKSEQPHAAAVALAIIGEGYGADLPNFPRHDAWSNQAAVLLTRRSLHLRKHAGQWALPGGRIEPGETAEQAALREMAEEVKLTLDASAIMGRLGDFVTCSGFDHYEWSRTQQIIAIALRMRVPRLACMQGLRQ